MLAIGKFLVQGHELWVISNIADIEYKDTDFWVDYYKKLGSISYVAYVHEHWNDGTFFVSSEEAESYAFNQSLESYDEIKRYDFCDIAPTKRMTAFMKAYRNAKKL